MCDDSKEQHELVRVVEFVLQYGTQEDIQNLTKAVNVLAEEIQAKAKVNIPA